jgi:hypothetical protein
MHLHDHPAEAGHPAAVGPPTRRRSSSAGPCPRAGPAARSPGLAVTARATATASSRRARGHLPLASRPPRGIARPAPAGPTTDLAAGEPVAGPRIGFCMRRPDATPGHP